MDFGKKLKKLLKEKDMTQTDLANKINISHPVISRWIKGHSNNPKMETLEKIAKALNVDVRYFVDDRNDIELKNSNINDNNNIINLIMKLIEDQNRISIENNKKFEAEISLLKKEIEFLKIKFDKRK